MYEKGDIATLTFYFIYVIMTTRYHEDTHRKETIMKAIDFFKSYQALFEQPDILAVFKKVWKKREDFTKSVMPHIASILSEHGYAGEHQYEYYKIDVIGWKSCKENLADLPKPGSYALKEHFWYLGVAVEHENDPYDWTDELVKLLYINCPLRIVIGYYPETLLPYELEQTIDYASKMVAMANEKKDLVRADQEYLLILGKNHADTENLSKETYSAYVYDCEQKRFKPLNR